MQVSIEVKPELYQYMESTASSLGKSISEIIAEKFQPEFDKIQQAKKELTEFLKPAIIAAKNGDVVDQTFDEIVNEALDEIAEGQKN